MAYMVGMPERPPKLAYLSVRLAVRNAIALYAVNTRVVPMTPSVRVRTLARVNPGPVQAEWNKKRITVARGLFQF